MARPRRLYVRLYLAFLGVLVAVLAVSLGITVVFGRGPIPFFRQAPRFGDHLARALPPVDDPLALNRAVEQFHEELGIDVLVLDLWGTPIAAAGTPIPAPPAHAFAAAQRGPTWMPRPPLLGAPVRPRRGAPAQAVLIVVIRVLTARRPEEGKSKKAKGKREERARVFVVCCFSVPPTRCRVPSRAPSSS